MADTNTYISKQKVEKWTTKEKFNALELATIETGTEYNLTGPIDETDLASNLQTKINEINGKLNKPTNPSAESAVTMTADGTVGTKPLSEIGGGGGKLYRHYVKISQAFQIYLTLYRPTLNEIESIDGIVELNNNALIVGIYTDGDVLVTVKKVGTSLKVNGLVYEYSNIRVIDVNIPISETSIMDTATEV